MTHLSWQKASKMSVKFRNDTCFTNMAICLRYLMSTCNIRTTHVLETVLTNVQFGLLSIFLGIWCHKPSFHNVISNTHIFDLEKFVGSWKRLLSLSSTVDGTLFLMFKWFNYPVSLKHAIPRHYLPLMFDI